MREILRAQAHVRPPIMLDILKQINEYSGAISALACIVSVLAFIIALKSWSLKYKARVCGQIVSNWSNISSMPYIGSLVLHNLKDKELAIHNIYVRYGKNVYLNLLNKDELSLNYTHILPPFGTVTFEFGPAYAYVDGTMAVDVSQILQEEKWQIVLSTNEGKVVVKDKNRYWSPIIDTKGNYYDRIISPWRADSNRLNNTPEINDRTIRYDSYGDRMKYLVIFFVNGEEKDCPIYADDFERCEYLRGITYDIKDLKDEGSLRKFLNKQKKAGNIKFDKIVRIIDAQAWYKRDWDRLNATRKVIVKPINRTKYWLFGYFLDFWYNHISRKKRGY